MESIWRQTVQIPGRECLPGDRKAEVAVIGAGLAGLLAAYYLQEQGREVVVLEAAEIGSGQTGGTTAKITCQHAALYSKLIEKYGRERAARYAGANQRAIEAYVELIGREGIDCHFEFVDSYLYTAYDKEALRLEAEAAAAAGIRAHYAEHPHFPFPAEAAVCFEHQAQFHPLEFVKHIAEKLTVYEHTRVLKVHGHQVRTDRGIVTAEHIVFATHYPFPVVPGFYFLRQHQERSYVLALRGIPKWEGMYYGIDDGGLSYRWYEDILLVGGGGHRTGDMSAGCGYAALREQVRELFPEGEEVAHWGAQDCITHDELPFIGRFSLLRGNWYVITGLKKWGMTGSMVAAQIICDRICGRTNPCESLFKPQRMHFWAARKKLWEDVRYSVSGLGKGFLGKRLQCPHMGCALEWNAQERTWDCPCHGSRFDERGCLIDEPAQGNIRLS